MLKSISGHLEDKEENATRDGRGRDTVMIIYDLRGL